ncbi:MAG: M67 family metallopeptidase [Deltaproteobacteria bacterium]|jgi:proteasome lid subunit RPN8/RPN11|nr:M67 family metallopeptidase [Deltaproteobacteria bacterium]
MKITLSHEVFAKILNHAREQFPLEACGLIAGQVKDDLIEITQAYPLKNVQESRERFSIDPQDQLIATKTIRSQALTPLGNFHSHPETPARPSPEDLKLYLDPKATYLIISLAERQPVVKAFGLQIEDGQTLPVERDLEILKPNKGSKLN